jgi:hypothetical protein
MRGAGLRRESDDDELANHVVHDYTQADIDPQTRVSLDYATRPPPPPDVKNSSKNGSRALLAPKSGS